mmetsp:Transcript_16508/g.24990  ORF Transcript_16508/g.24990 Transcript_16508/m.24990 type:complete len:88 (-) Transcript_16508:654-917(-)
MVVAIFIQLSINYFIYSSILLSIAEKSLKNALNRARPWVKSFTPIVSLILCIESCGHPISIALMPVAVEITGPMVLPQPQSFLTTNS